MSIERHRERIARTLREQVETNTVSSLASFQAKVTEAFDLDRSPEAQRELRLLIQELYDEYNGPMSLTTTTSSSRAFRGATHLPLRPRAIPDT